MSPWLALVIGVILGLLIGWLLELLYRRRQSAASLEPVKARTTPPDWVAPPPAAPVPPEVAPLGVAPEAAAAPETPASLTEPELPAPTEPPAAPEPPQAPEAAVVPAAPEPLVELDRSQPVDSASLSGVAADTEPEATAAPAVEAHIADELPVTDQGLPAEAIDALTPSVLEGERATAPIQTTEGRDKLIIIEGIGPVYEKKLNSAGINTFRQLIAASDEQLRAIIQPQSWQRVNFAEWIEQAQLIVDGKDEELKALQARLFSRKKA